jgi:hypothetical protein
MFLLFPHFSLKALRAAQRPASLLLESRLLGHFLDFQMIVLKTSQHINVLKNQLIGYRFLPRAGLGGTRSSLSKGE